MSAKASAAPQAQPAAPSRAVETRLTGQRSAASPSRYAPPAVNDLLSAPGQPLDPSTRADMEKRFSQNFTRVPTRQPGTSPAYVSIPHQLQVGQPGDPFEQEARGYAASIARRNNRQDEPQAYTIAPSFASIRVYTGAAADASAAQVNAQAYTVGPNLVFRSGAFQPHTPAGRLLLAHELSHSLQQASLGQTLLQRQEGPETAPRTITRIRVYRTERLMLVFISDGSAPLVFNVGGEISGQPQQVFTMHSEGGGYTVTNERAEQVDIVFNGRQSDIDTFNQLLAASHAGVPLEIVETAPRSSTDRPEHAPTADGSPTGEVAEPLHGDESIFASNRPLAELYLTFLDRFADLHIDASRAENGLSAEDVHTITADNARAVTVTQYFTQGWREFEAAGGQDITSFAVLEEAILTQWMRGNFNVLNNLLQISSDQDGLGIFRRGTPLRYYDPYGQPIAGYGGGYHDIGFRAAAPPSSAITIHVPPGLLQVLQAVRQTGVDDPTLVYQAAQGYYDNSDIIMPAVRDGWDGWPLVEAEWHRQCEVMVYFLAGHLVALVLERSGTPWGTAVGLALDGMLRVAGRLLMIAFVGEMLYLAYRAGAELSLIHRQPDGTLDPLSQRHLSGAVVLLRELIVQVSAAGLTAATIAAARSTAITVGEAMDRGGGGGAGPQPQLATAVAGGRGTGSAGSTGAPALEGGPSPTPPRLPGTVIAPSAAMMQGSDTGSGGEPGAPSRAPTADAPAEPRSRAARPEPSGPEPEPAGPASSRGGSLPPTESRPGETGAEFERRMQEYQRETADPNSARYNSWMSNQRGSFRGWVRQLGTHLGRFFPRGSAPMTLDASVNDMNTHAFLESRPDLAAEWRAMSERVSARMIEITRQMREAGSDRRRVAELQRQYEAAQELHDELADFERGNVGDKRPDLIEIMFEDRRIVVTDWTQNPRDPLHNLKTRFYVEVVKAITGWTNVVGIDFADVTDQEFFE
jgi:hypothetical protein